MRLLAVPLMALSLTAGADDAGGRFESLLGFKVNAATLGDVATRFGTAERFEIPEGHHDFAICYRLTDAPGIVMFESSGEFGGPEQLLLGLSVQEDNSRNFPCAISRISTKQLTFVGLRLGMTEEQFRTVVGEPVEYLDNGDLIRFFVSERKLNADELKSTSAQWPGSNKSPAVDVTHSVWGRLTHGRIVAFGCTRVETL